MLSDGNAQGTQQLPENPEDILIVANKTVPVDSLTMDDLRQIFLKRRKKWSGGHKIVPIHVKGDPALRERIRKELLSMTAAEEKDHWEDQKLRTGIKEPPEIRQNLRAVFSLKGSISYVYRKDYKKGVVKILAVLPTQ